MRPADIFGIIVRVIGLFITMAALPYVFVSLFFVVATGGHLMYFGALLGAAFLLLIGVWMLRGAPELINFAYPIVRHDARMQQELR